MARHFIEGKSIACDTETTGLDHWKEVDQPFAFSFCNEVGETAYFEFPLDPLTRKVQIPKDMLRMLQDFFGDESIEKVYWNAKFDIRMCSSVGIETKGVVQEASFAARTCYTVEQNYRLKPLAEQYFSVDADDEEILQKTVTICRRHAAKLYPDWKLGGHVAQDYWLPGRPEMGKYLSPKQRKACKTYGIIDAVRTMLLWLGYKWVMDREDLWDTYNREMRLWPITYAMESRGLYFNDGVAYDEIEIQEARVENEQAIIDKAAGRAIDLRSARDIGWLLYTKLGLKAKGRTKRGHEGTDFDSLRRLGQNLVARSVLNYKSAQKSIDTAADHLSRAVKDPVSGGLCVHGDLNQMDTRTGRYASQRPNLQNLSSGKKALSKGVVPFNARAPFGPRPGWVWILLDYSQLEGRIFSYVAKERFMLRSFENGKDLHSACANRAWSIKDSETAVNKAARSLCFGINGIYPSPEILKVWKKYKFSGIKHLDDLRNGKSLPASCNEEGLDIAEDYLKKYKWNLVKMEKSIGSTISRGHAKQIFFLKIYAGGKYRASEQMECTIDEAARFLKEWSSVFPDVDKYIRSMTDQAIRQKKIVTLYDRRLNIDASRPYTAVNYSIQSPAADLIKRSMIRIDDLIKQEKRDIHLILQVHDELIYEMREDDLDLLPEIKWIMEDSEGHIGVETPVDISIARESWAEVQEVSLEDLGLSEKGYSTIPSDWGKENRKIG